MISSFTTVEYEIEHVFHTHQNELFKQKYQTLNQITNWNKDLIGEIQQYTNNQRALVEQTYLNLIEKLEVERDRFKSKLLHFNEQKNDEELKQLLDQCSALKLHLGQNHQPSKTIRIVNFIPANSNNVLESVPVENVDGTVTKSKADQKSMSESATQTIEISTELAVKTDESQLKIDQNKKCKIVEEQYENTVESCPLCFMIFHASMSHTHRSQHVNGHY